MVVNRPCPCPRQALEPLSSRNLLYAASAPKVLRPRQRLASLQKWALRRAARLVCLTPHSVVTSNSFHSRTRPTHSATGVASPELLQGVQAGEKSSELTSRWQKAFCWRTVERDAEQLVESNTLILNMCGQWEVSPTYSQQEHQQDSFGAQTKL